MSIKNLSYLIYFIIFNLLISQDYLWPTNASNTVTAFFAEERPRRYHAGIDIRTYGKTGFEIYAIEDGYIEKIKINYKGYGNTLYLKLKDGNTAVYAHLESFYPELNEIINIIKKDYNTQVIEHFFNKQDLIVKKGEIIGYTGDTGTISGPHLHFEIRDKNNISINPLINFYTIEDNIPPTPQKIAFIPKSKNTKIDGFSDIKLCDINKNNETEYHISDTISVVGKFGVALNIIDQVNKQPFNYGLYKLQLYIDGELKYKIEYNEYNFSDGKLVQEERNYYLKRREQERYYNLYNSTPELSFIDKRSWPYYKLEEGIHNMVIKASDVNNNEIIIFGTIISDIKQELLYTINQNEKTTDFYIDEQDDSYEYIIDICNKYDGTKIKRLKTKEKEISIENSIISDPFNVISLHGRKINGLKTKKQYYQPFPKDIDDIKGTFEIKNFNHGALIQFVEESFSNKTASINLILKDSVISYQTNRIKQNILSTEIINYSNLEKLESLEIEYDTKPRIKIKNKINSMLFYPNNGIYLSDNEFIFGENINFTKDTALIWISKNQVDIPEKLTLLSGPFETNPKTLIFDKKLNISFKYENNEQGIGIYYYDNKMNQWIYLDTKYDNGIYSSLVLSNETFALLSEQIAPTIKNLIPDTGATYKSKDLDNLIFYIDDELSGIRGVDNISVKIDDIPVLFEYNSYRKEVIYNFEEWFTIGEHFLDIEITDNVGNVAKRKGKFTIK